MLSSDSSSSSSSDSSLFSSGPCGTYNPSSSYPAVCIYYVLLFDVIVDSSIGVYDGVKDEQFFFCSTNLNETSETQNTNVAHKMEKKRRTEHAAIVGHPIRCQEYA